jgi:hypothetical protein
VTARYRRLGRGFPGSAGNAFAEGPQVLMSGPANYSRFPSVKKRDLRTLDLKPLYFRGLRKFGG